MLKLVVIDSFDKFKRGEQIFDQELINNILNPNHPMHSNERHVRRVFMSEFEKSMYVVPSKVNEEPKKSEKNEENDEELEAEIHLKSINPNAE